ncbi:MAG: NAD(P)-dependent oxidoreductase [Nitrospinaceae bacterium]|jgi:nucleoside-diphosphate-sugar epimerase|nr:NAD(P)-dependent oxidoreductase [Nitrospinaceae bacterium]
MKILVTGAAGYIGSVLVPLLLKKGHEIIAIDNFMYKQTSLLECCYSDRFSLINGDVRNTALVEKYLKKVDAVLPLACLTGAPLCDKDPITARSVNFEAIKSILEKRSPNQIIIFPTTNSGYGIGEKSIQCTEDTPLRPVSLYGQLKVEIEKMILESGNSITFRFATVFGVSPRMRLDLLVNDFTYRAYYDRFIVLFEAHFKRNYLHVRDAAQAFVFGLENFEQMKNEAYNVGLSDANISKSELCKVIKTHIQNFYFSEADIGEDIDKRDYTVSNKKIESTGFKTEYSLSFGVQELIKGFQIIKKTEYGNI